MVWFAMRRLNIKVSHDTPYNTVVDSIIAAIVVPISAIIFWNTKLNTSDVLDHKKLISADTDENNDRNCFYPRMATGFIFFAVYKKKRDHK